MATFLKGLSDPFVARLNEEYARGGWWAEVLKDKDLYLGIRNEYVNVYYKGNSLMKVTHRDGELCAEVHYKYLLKPEAEPTYVVFKDGRREPLSDALFMGTLDPGLLKRTSSWYAGEEKQGVHDIVRSNPNIIDLEIALATADEAAERQSAKRIDFAALQPVDGAMCLVFFEAKHFTNPELRASGDAAPKVMKQVQRYEKLIAAHRPEIEEAYRRICENLCQLEGIRSHLRNLAEMVTKGRPLIVEEFPRLAVFGFDDDQRSAPTGRSTWRSLQAEKWG